jgi:proteasome lid subunit RPN8/RPN11
MNQHGLVLSTAQLEQMCRHIREQVPLEACGLLGGKNNRVEIVIPIRNAAQSPVRFRMDALEQLKALEVLEDTGLELLAIYHSHPVGPPCPSPTDIEEAAYPVVYIIWSPNRETWQARGFWLDSGCAAEVSLTLEDG